MKKLIKLKSLFILCLVICFYSCDGGEAHHKNTSNYVTVVIEDCEYIYNTKETVKAKYINVIADNVPSKHRYF